MNKYIKRGIQHLITYLGLIDPSYSAWRCKNGTSLKKIDYIKNHQDCIVLGNGPSLSKDIKTILPKADHFDFCCVNNFSLSNYYQTLKPTSYVFLDSYFWAKDAHKDWIEQREKTFSAIRENTTWKMKIFLPRFADCEMIAKKIDNENVDVIKLNVSALSTVSGELALKLYETGYFSPGHMNVLIYAIYLPIYAGYETISIYGADLTFHNNIDVEQTTNDVLFKQTHFYGESSYSVFKKNPQKQDKFSMREIMQVTADTFLAHEMLAKFAQKRGVKVINKSSYSLIDAYERQHNQNKENQR